MSATLASPLNTGNTVPALTPVTVPCRTPTCAWTPAAPSNSPVTMDNVFSFFMCALRYRVARRLAGSGALYWRRREFGYLSQSRADPTRQPSRPAARAGPCLRVLLDRSPHPDQFHAASTNFFRRWLYADGSSQKQAWPLFAITSTWA